MKAILLIDMPKNCLDCPLNIPSYDDDFEEIMICNATKLESHYGEIPSWCPLKHPLKEVSNDFYIYDANYLFANLDREISNLKSTERFREYMRGKQE